MYEAAVVTAWAPATSELIPESRAIATSYSTAPSTGFQLSSSGCVGKEIDAPLAGERSSGAWPQTFRNECVTHCVTEPFLRTARTRHQYRPSWSVLVRV